MRAICFDPVAGAAGDMILASLLDLGASPETVDQTLRSSGLDGFELHFTRRPCGAILCGSCTVNVAGGHGHGHGYEHGHKHDNDHGHGHEHEHKHDNDHGHGHGHGHKHDNEHEHGHEHDNDHEHGHKHDNGHGHGHEHEHKHDHGHGHEHGHGPGKRALGDILELIARTRTPERARRRAAAIFQRMGEAEAAVHGMSLAEVHFHEVGAVDAIVDILGTCIALELLGVDKVYCGTHKVGNGTVKCAHGVLPLPAPATVKLLEGHRFVRLPVNGELTTPTGAAILTTLSAGDWQSLDCSLVRCGCGRGSRDYPELPNLIRAFLVEESRGLQQVEVLETDIDDESPEIVATLPELLRQAGALDATLTQTIMKKGRPGMRLSAIAPPELTPKLAELIFRNSSTIGVRVYRAGRFVLPRRQVTAETPWGTVAAKEITRPDGAIEVTPEFEDCRRLAAEKQIPLREVMRAVPRQ